MLRHHRITGVTVLLLFLLLINLPAMAQNSCWDCDVDSLKRELPGKSTDAERLQLLTLIVDLQGVSITNRFIDSAVGNRVNYINTLLQLNRKLKVLDPAPYERLRSAMLAYDQEEYLSALEHMKAAVELFDQQKKIIVVLLANIRNMYNLLKMQDERLHYYTGKLNYYLSAGPVENAAPCYHALGGYYIFKADYNMAISNYLKAAEIFRNFYHWYYINDIMVVGDTYALWGNYERAKYYLEGVLPLIKSIDNRINLAFCLSALARIAFEQGHYQPALQYADGALGNWSGTGNVQGEAVTVLLKAKVILALENPGAALPLLLQAGELGKRVGTDLNTLYGNFEEDFVFYQYYSQIKDYASAEKYLLRAYAAAEQESSDELQLKYLRELYRYYGLHGEALLAMQYAGRYFALKDAIDQKHNEYKVASYEFEQSSRQKEDSILALNHERAIQDVKLTQRNTVLGISLGAVALGVLLLIFLYRQLKINRKTLRDLKEAQAQLVLREKMASLGELTAGVAHEIQNPLNFINNFSEINAELLEELNTVITAGNWDEARSISKDIADNQQKITSHGKRASSIVKGMLQHSRAATGTKEITDINALVEEYMRLSYQGMRSRDKDFNAMVDTNLDHHMGQINVIPQDVGRVLLNLFNNAFYAVWHKKQLIKSDYQPAVMASTLKKDGKIEIHIRDNGTGIPTRNLDKVFQPFFTTKPTGQGTGLGLSISYDIITKGYGGVLSIDTCEGEYTEVIIQLPVQA